MRLTMQELRGMVRRALLKERGPGLTRADVYTHVQYDPKTQTFKDRWGHEIRGPESMQLRDVSVWLDNNNVESVSVRGKSMAPRAFMRHLGNVPGKAIPIVRGQPVPGGEPLLGGRE